MRTNKAKRNYCGGTISPTPHGTFAAYISVNGARRRATLKTLEEAKAWLEAIAAGAPSLPAARVRDAIAALEILPHGVTLREAAEFFLAQNTRAQKIELAAAVETYLQKREPELRARTMQSYRQILTAAAKRMPQRLDLHNKPAARAFVDSYDSAHSRNRAIRSLSAFYSWCIDDGIMAGANPCDGLRLSKVAEPNREVLTPQQAAHLLKTAIQTDRRTVPYFAICLFAGLRPDECMRLTPAHIGENYIRVTADIAKTSAARTVAIRPNLRTFLDRFYVPNAGVLGGLSTGRFRKAIGAVIAASGLDWVQDIMRHSFASYAYELTNDAAGTAAEMGHRGVDIFFKHYRGLVPPRSGLQFFSIRAKAAQPEN